MAVVERLHRHAYRSHGTFHWRDVGRLFRSQKGRCHYCGSQFLRKRGTRLVGVQAFRFHIEHKIPVCRGGSNFPQNLALACHDCNMSKGTMTDAEFQTGSGLLSDDKAARRLGGAEPEPQTALKAGPTDLELAGEESLGI